MASCLNPGTWQFLDTGQDKCDHSVVAGGEGRMGVGEALLDCSLYNKADPPHPGGPHYLHYWDYKR